ncbi:hypothetical protein [Arenibacter troitsensis]|uniref:Uncharacterized protein n=1 Tax=Arenibacter troitsensis TaxID=188872 RepID=A0A1X7J7F1_9FLAO|nr:hypothetical protein [Arenibacter troitsensis]SMG23612.1 hypothetical protein SAMN03080602_01462 [Arenibacter troitsensis]
MESTLKKRIPLMVNEPLRNELEKSTKVILEKISIIQSLSKDNLGIDLSNPDNAMGFIRKYSKQEDIENVELQNELLFIKFGKEVSKLTSDHPSIIKLKALEMFCTQTDRDKTKEVIHYAVSINIGVEKLNAEIDLEHFVLNDEFIYNSKLDTRLKELYTTYCKNNKQKEIKEFTEKISEIIKHAMKIGLISNSRLGVNPENFIDINTGDINYYRIAGLQ